MTRSHRRPTTRTTEDVFPELVETNRKTPIVHRECPKTASRLATTCMPPLSLRSSFLCVSNPRAFQIVRRIGGQRKGAKSAEKTDRYELQLQPGLMSTACRCRHATTAFPAGRAGYGRTHQPAGYARDPGRLMRPAQYQHAYADEACASKIVLQPQLVQP